LSQSSNPALQKSTVHLPLWHPAVPFGMVQALPQPPQLAGSLAVFAHLLLQHVVPP
jgi:hypothetical protein